MSNQLSVTADGAHNVGNRAFLTVGGVHRRAVKAYLTVDGVHRLCYQEGVEWLKYGCVVDTYYSYQENYDTRGDVYGPTRHGVSSSSRTTCCSGYDFDPDQGYTGTGEESVHISDAAGMYDVSATEVLRYAMVTFVETANGYDYYDVTMIVECTAEEHEFTDYYKGGTAYGSVYAPEGQAPDGGTVVAGSVTGSWCVVDIGGLCYYYERA